MGKGLLKFLASRNCVTPAICLPKQTRLSCLTLQITGRGHTPGEDWCFYESASQLPHTKKRWNTSVASKFDWRWLHHKSKTAPNFLTKRLFFLGRSCLCSLNIHQSHSLSFTALTSASDTIFLFSWGAPELWCHCWKGLSACPTHRVHSRHWAQRSQFTLCVLCFSVGPACLVDT